MPNFEEKINQGSQTTPSPEEMEILRKKACYILSAYSGSISGPSINSSEEDSKFENRITGIEKRDDGFYNVNYKALSNESVEVVNAVAVLDLDFPFSEKDVNTVLEEKDEEGLDKCLIIGPGITSLPDKNSEGKRTGDKRSFVISELGFGVPYKDENILGKSEFGFSVGGYDKSYIRDLPDHSHLFNRLDLDTIKENSFDMIQLCNVLNDPNTHGIVMDQLVRLLKPVTGELIIAGINTPDHYSLDWLESEAKRSGCDVEVVLKGKETEDEVDEKPPLELVEKLQQEYYVSPLYTKSFYKWESSAYVVIIRKGKKI